MTIISIETYMPRTKFLKGELAKANFGEKSAREYIVELCNAEDAAYRHQVRHEPVPFYGDYTFLHPEQYGPYRKEYFEMLKELSYKDYVRVVAEELFSPARYGPGRLRKAFRLDEFDAKDKAALTDRKMAMAKEDADDGFEKQQEQVEEKKGLTKLRGWWLKNGGKT